jgi:hypothetical protein
MTKSIFASKTFWFNVATALVTYGGYLPPKYAAIVLPLGNIALRFLTDAPVSVTGA